MDINTVTALVSALPCMFAMLVALLIIGYIFLSSRPKEKSWVNTEHVVSEGTGHPCRTLNYCPYGQLVEEFPFSEDGKQCNIFGHDCPVHYHYEPVTEGKVSGEESNCVGGCIDE